MIDIIGIILILLLCTAVGLGMWKLIIVFVDWKMTRKYIGMNLLENTQRRLCNLERKVGELEEYIGVEKNKYSRRQMNNELKDWIKGRYRNIVEYVSNKNGSDLTEAIKSFNELLDKFEQEIKEEHNEVWKQAAKELRGSVKKPREEKGVRDAVINNTIEDYIAMQLKEEN